MIVATHLQPEVAIVGGGTLLAQTMPILAAQDPAPASSSFDVADSMHVVPVYALAVAAYVQDPAAASRPGVAQSPALPLVFDVASIKLSLAVDRSGGSRMLPGGVFTATNISAEVLIANAFGLSTNRIVGGPDWIRTQRYNIEARAAGDPPLDAMAQLVLSLLRERFRLVAHRETRNMPIYRLLALRANGVLGPRLKPSAVNCDDPAERKKAGTLPNGAPTCGSTFVSRGHLRGGGMKMNGLAQVLAPAAGRPVVNETGLSGGYNIELQWAAVGGSTDDPDLVPVFTAVQEQLGLKLENGTAPLEVVVVDQIERPRARTKSECGCELVPVTACGPRRELNGSDGEAPVPTVPFLSGSKMIVRIRDVLVGTLFVILFAPLIAVVAIGVRWSTRGPVLHRALSQFHGLTDRLVRNPRMTQARPKPNA